MRGNVFKIYYSELLFILIFCFIYFTKTNSILNSDTDLLWNIRQGDWILENKKLIMNKEIFTYLFDENNWTYLSWIANIIFSFLYKIGGFSAVIVFVELLITFTLYLVFKYLVNKKVNPFKAFFIIFLYSLYYMIHWLPRNVLFSYFFIVVWFIIIDAYYSEKDKKKLYFLPILNIIWVNIHSSFLYGFIIGAMFLFGMILEGLLEKNWEKIKETKFLFFIGFISFLTTFLNPFGWKGHLEFLNSFIYSKKSYEFFYSRIMEYLSFDFHGGILFNLLFVILIFLILFYKKKKLNLPYIFLFVFWQNSGLKFSRHIAVFGLIIMLTLPQMIEIDIKFNWLIKFKKYLSKFNIFHSNSKYFDVRIFVVIVALFFIFGIQKTFENFNGIKMEIFNKRFPVASTEYLKKNRIEGNGFNNYFAGGYLIWEFYPEKIVFMDPRATVYPEETLESFYHIYDFGNYAFKLLEVYNIKWLFLSKEDFTAIALRYREDIVDIVYEEEQYVIYKLKENKNWLDEKEVDINE